MSIVKMKRLQLIGLAAERDEFLRKLQPMGCVEFSDATALLSDPELGALLKPDAGSVGVWEREQALLLQALKVLDRYAPVKAPLFTIRKEITHAQLTDEATRRRAKDAAGTLLELERRIAALEADESALRSDLHALDPWVSLDFPLDCTGTRTTRAALASVPAAVSLEAVETRLNEATQLAQVVPAGSDKEQHCFLVLYHAADAAPAEDALRAAGASLTAFPGRKGTARENRTEVERRLTETAREKQGCLEAVAGLGGARDALKLAADRASQEIERERTKSRLITDGKVFAMEGWIPAPQAEKTARVLEHFCCCWELRDPLPGDQVPTKLQNNRFTEPLTMVTEMYSLPSYDGVDPNPLMLPFFATFFGIMYADMGYGLILMLLCLLGTKKLRPRGTMKYMLGLAGLCGFTTLIFGALTGSCFGDAIPVVAAMYGKTVVMPKLFSPLDDPLVVLIGALALGCVQLLTGMAIKAVMLIREGHWKDALFDVGSWWLLFAGIAVGALGVTWWVAIAGVAALILTQGRSKSSLIGKLVGGISSLYDITSYLGDVLSYSRLMALMLAGGVVAQVMNTLGSFTGNIIAFAVIFLIGHALNMAINVLGCYVHTSRLMYLEYFGKFYRDGGRPFRPLSLNTKYVDIVKEEK